MSQLLVWFKRNLNFVKFSGSRADDQVFYQIKIPWTPRGPVGRKRLQTILCHSNRPPPCPGFAAWTCPDTAFSGKCALYNRLPWTGCSTLCTRYLFRFGRHRPSSKWIAARVWSRAIGGRKASGYGVSSTCSNASSRSYRWLSDVCQWLCSCFATLTSPLRTKFFC